MARVNYLRYFQSYIGFYDRFTFFSFKGVFGRVHGHRRYTEDSKSSNSKMDRLQASAVVAGIAVVLEIVTICVNSLLKCCVSPLESLAKTYLLSSKSCKLNTFEMANINPFQSGVWLSRYFQHGIWHGTHQFPLLFDSGKTKVKGFGSDDVGDFTVTGAYSAAIGRVNLTKLYIYGTGDSQKNLGHQVSIQLTWNRRNDQFNGTWAMITGRSCDSRGAFELQYDKESIMSEVMSTV